MISVFDRLCKRLHLAPNGCLEWQGATHGKGYGHIRVGRRDEGMVGTHRVAYEAAFGPIPDGMNVLHTCDNPPCCEPEHLWLGTDADNAADRKKKGRNGDQFGEKNGSAKLTWEKVEMIRADARVLREIAAEHGVSKAQISRIKRGERWLE